MTNGREERSGADTASSRGSNSVRIGAILETNEETDRHDVSDHPDAIAASDGRPFRNRDDDSKRDEVMGLES
ncbi:hypothetical protein OB955_02125 [Halobacteria archaeon AArc-m2/3/4]|uniref:Uncharacterized protein n=1 Tax=Natronoglomus mannanivorans TaxID=2979990 RepID=A0ABT2Q9C9_9EURY|nr:hypothetical protein [Halobacteria archaeon AArc-m2/3/4]